MRIVRRNPELKYPRSRPQRKAAARPGLALGISVSSFALLARRLGLTCHTSYKFFRALRDNGLVQRFAHVHYNREQYYMLTRAGAAVLHEAGRDSAHACTAPSRLVRYPHVPHALAVQRAAIRRLDNSPN